MCEEADSIGMGEPTFIVPAKRQDAPNAPKRRLEQHQDCPMGDCEMAHTQAMRGSGIAQSICLTSRGSTGLNYIACRNKWFRIR